MAALFVLVMAVVLGLAVVIEKAKKQDSLRSEAKEKEAQAISNNKKTTQRSKQSALPTEKKGYVDLKSSLSSNLVASVDDHQHVGEKEEIDYYSGSLGEHNSEGCGTHQFVRFLVAEEETEEKNFSEIAKTIVLGDVLAHPKYRARKK